MRRCAGVVSSTSVRSLCDAPARRGGRQPAGPVGLRAPCDPGRPDRAADGPTSGPASRWPHSNIADAERGLWYALDTGAFAGCNLDVDARAVAGGTNTVATLVAGHLELVVVDGSEGPSSVATGADLDVVTTSRRSRFHARPDGRPRRLVTPANEAAVYSSATSSKHERLQQGAAGLPDQDPTNTICKGRTPSF
jgi:hypothetical protein